MKMNQFFFSRLYVILNLANLNSLFIPDINSPKFIFLRTIFYLFLFIPNYQIGLPYYVIRILMNIFF